MKFTRWIYLIVLLALLSACGSGGGVTPPGATRISSLPTAQVTVIPAPSTDASLRAFLGSLQANDYTSMYKQISTASQAVIPVQAPFTVFQNKGGVEIALEITEQDCFVRQTESHLGRLRVGQ